MINKPHNAKSRESSVVHRSELLYADAFEMYERKLEKRMEPVL